MRSITKLALAYKNLREHMLRSLLTLVSIAVSITAIVSLIIIGQSMEQAVGERLQGTVDVVRIFPGHVIPGRDFVPYGSFAAEDALAVKAIPGVADASSWMIEIAEVQYQGRMAPVELMGGDPADIRGFLGGVVKLEEGRLIAEGADREVILSTSTLEHINRWLQADLGINDTITINGVDFTIVGIMAYDIAGIEVSHRVLLSKAAAKELTGSQVVMLMLARVDDLNRVEEIKEQIEATLDARHGVSGLTTAVAAESVLDQVGMVFLIIQGVVVSIALIALVVGGIGIVNIMFMAVAERTREIGVMKAIGATNEDVLAMFLIEAATLSLAGGIVGVVTGVALGAITSSFIGRFVIAEMPLVVNPWVLGGGLLIALLTGVVSGLYPARRAANMKPIEALRYE